MKASLVVLAGIAVVGVAISPSSRVSAAPATSTARRETTLSKLPPVTAAGETTSWGHIKSLVRKGRRFEMRFDPAWLLGGVTAERAALEDTGSADVPNDRYTVEEGHRLLTYVVVPNARVTVLLNGPRPATITVAELAQIIEGKNPKRRPLFGRPKDFGFWIRVGNKYPNPVLSLDEQYQP